MLFRAVFKFYNEEFESALEDFKEASMTMHEGKELGPGHALETNSVQSSNTDLSDVGLCALNVHEFTYNKVICLLMQNTEDARRKAFDDLCFLVDTIPARYSNNLWVLRGAVAKSLGEEAISTRDFEMARKRDANTFKQFFYS